MIYLVSFSHDLDLRQIGLAFITVYSINTYDYCKIGDQLLVLEIHVRTPVIPSMLASKNKLTIISNRVRSNNHSCVQLD